MNVNPNGYSGPSDIAFCTDPTHDRVRCCCRAGGDVVELVEVWCDKCDQPATTNIQLTTGETVARCSQHAWLIVAPKGAK